MRRGNERLVPEHVKRRGLLEPCSSPGRFTVWEFFSEKRQRALGNSRTTPGTPRTNRREILKPVTSLPPSDPREREPGLHLNRPDCNSTDTTARPSEGSHGVAQTLLFAERMREGYKVPYLAPHASKDFEGPEGRNAQTTNEFSRSVPTGQRS
jgi:hypothetical protein